MNAYPFTDYTLTDQRGHEWTFHLNCVTATVTVISPTQRTGEPCTMRYHRVFMRDTLAQLPKDAVMQMFAEARVFTNGYPTVVKPYTHDDGMGNTFEVGICIRFTRNYPSVVMERDDARRLWGLLSSAR